MSHLVSCEGQPQEHCEDDPNRFCRDLATDILPVTAAIAIVDGDYWRRGFGGFDRYLEK
jgi:hypothetical protein